MALKKGEKQRAGKSAATKIRPSRFAFRPPSSVHEDLRAIAFQERMRIVDLVRRGASYVIEQWEERRRLKPGKWSEGEKRPCISVTLGPKLRAQIKREARQHGKSMNAALIDGVRFIKMDRARGVLTLTYKP